MYKLIKKKADDKNVAQSAHEFFQLTELGYYASTCTVAEISGPEHRRVQSIYKVPTHSPAILSCNTALHWHSWPERLLLKLRFVVCHWVDSDIHILLGLTYCSLGWKLELWNKKNELHRLNMKGYPDTSFQPGISFLSSIIPSLFLNHCFFSCL